MATTTCDYLMRRKAELETRMLEAQRRARAPFEDELRALSLALSAIERGGVESVPAETASFAPTPTRRGRKGRTTREMILMVLGQDDAAIAASEISRKLTRRWARVVPLATVMQELQGLEQEGLARRAGGGWVRLIDPAETAPAPRLALLA